MKTIAKTNIRNALCGLTAGLLLLAAGTPSASAKTALDFDGVNDFVQIPSSPSLQLTTRWTISAWIKWNGANGSVEPFQAVMSRPRSLTGTGVAIGLIPDGSLLGLYNNNVANLVVISSPGTIVAGVWTHIAYTYDGVALRLYKNGNQVASSVQSGLQLTVSTQPLLIGIEGLGAPISQRPFKGIVDEGAYYNVALTQAEVQSTMDCLSGNESGLKAYYKFDDGTGSSILSDLTANHNTGTLTNMDPATDWISSPFCDEPPVTPVAIDIKPGSPENTVNLGSKGVTKVAILGSEDFDATQVDPLTVKLADATVRVKGNGQAQTTIQDTNGDGFLDLVLHMETEGFSLTEGDVSATLTGTTFGGEDIEGEDLVRVVP